MPSDIGLCEFIMEKKQNTPLDSSNVVFRYNTVYEFQKSAGRQGNVKQVQKLIFLRALSAQHGKLYLFRSLNVGWIESFTQQQLKDYTILECKKSTPPPKGGRK
jgi:hypothetical protein